MQSKSFGTQADLWVWESVSYHETSSDIRLEDPVERALGEGTALEGEDFRDVTQTMFIMSSALYCHRGRRVIGAGFVLCCTRGLKYSVQLHRPAVVCRIAGVNGRLGVTLRLRETHTFKHTDYNDFTYSTLEWQISKDISIRYGPL